MTNKPDLAALKAAAAAAESEYITANAEKARWIVIAKDKWQAAAAASARYMRAKARMELAEMRTRGVVEAESGNGA